MYWPHLPTQRCPYTWEPHGRATQIWGSSFAAEKFTNNSEALPFPPLSGPANTLLKFSEGPRVIPPLVSQGQEDGRREDAGYLNILMSRQSKY